MIFACLAPPTGGLRLSPKLVLGVAFEVQFQLLWEGLIGENYPSLCPALGNVCGIQVTVVFGQWPI